MTARKSLSKKVRFDVFKRDVFTCQYCGSTPPSIVLEIDHIIPVSAGGDNCIDNLVASCFDCNRGKGALSLDVSPESLTDKASLIAEKRDQLKAYEKLLKANKASITRKVTKINNIFMDSCDRQFSDIFKVSVRKFLEKLPFPEVEDSMEIAISKDLDPDNTIKYFCGICWTKIKDADNG